ncbi:MAG: hypothetical protein ABJQ23_07770 [Shimia thalassica]|uniref:hypothetical protein n=1 Tax=Shimia thalassica TaxID=1715693 RepID=UPI00329A33F6
MELKIAADLDEYTQLDDGDGQQSWKRFGVLILFMMFVGLMLVSFGSYLQMLNVQGRIGLLGTNLSYDELLALQTEIGRSSAIWFYFSMASLACGAVLLVSALVLAFLRSSN